MSFPTPASERNIWRAMTVIGVISLVIQMAVATWVPMTFETPNLAATIARNLAATGGYACAAGGRLYGPKGGSSSFEMQMFHLPGEPLYLAAAIRWLPSFALRYVHVPVTVLLMVMTVYVSGRLYGASFAWMTGIIAMLQPFVVLHGPVWDDAFTSAALEWTVFALLISWCNRRPSSDRPSHKPWLSWLGIGALTGFAAITRASSQIVFAGTAVLILLTPSLRSIRPAAFAMLFGMMIALGMWGARNSMVMGQFAIGTSHDGITLWESVYPSSREALWTRGQTERLNNEKMQDDFVRTAGMTELEANQYFTRRATQYILAHPLDVAWTAANKLVVDLLGLSPPGSLFTPRNLVAVISNSLLLILAAHGAAVMRWRWTSPVARLWFYIILMSAFSFLVLACAGPVGLRYRISLDPVLWILAAGSLMHWLDKVKRPSSVI